jgi:hypothetical protein
MNITMIAGADISVTAGHQDHASARRTRLDQDDTGAANAHGLVGQSGSTGEQHEHCRSAQKADPPLS